MTRPDLAKAGYLALLLLLGGVSFALVLQAPPGPGRPLWAVFLGLLLLVPGRAQARLLRSHFHGRRAHQNGELEQASRVYRRQLAELDAHPWRNHAVWLGWMVWTTRADAMVWNNLAAVAVDQRQADATRQAVEHALALDPRYPLPWVNLAGAALMEGDRDEAQRCLDEAHRLGFRGATLDALLMRLNANWARVQAASTDPSPPV